MNGPAPIMKSPLHVGRPNICNREAFLARVGQILDNQWLTNNGPMVQEFESRIADRLGVKHCVAMCNGTIALEIAICALGLSGEVIVPSWTFVATAHALYWQGITPVFADIDPGTHNLDPSAVRRMITPRNTRLEQAISACGSGSTLAPRSLNSPALLLVLKTLRGEIPARDWAQFRQRMGTADKSWDNRRAPMLLVYNARRGVRLDQQELLEVFATQGRTLALRPEELVIIGDFIMNGLDKPDLAMPYFTKAMGLMPPDHPFPLQLASDLRAKGRPDLADGIDELVSMRQSQKIGSTQRTARPHAP